MVLLGHAPARVNERKPLLPLRQVLNLPDLNNGDRDAQAYELGRRLLHGAGGD